MTYVGRDRADVQFGHLLPEQYPNALNKPSSNKFQAMDHYRMDFDTTRSFFTTACESMSSMKILEDSTSGTSPDFVAWEMLTEVTYNVDEPALGIKKGSRAKLRGLSLQWWRWEGEGKEWKGDLSEEGIRGWKIVKENDYFVTLKVGAKGERLGWL